MSSKQRLLELNARLAQNLTDKGVEATADETTTALVNKVADIQTGSADLIPYVKSLTFSSAISEITDDITVHLEHIGNIFQLFYNCYLYCPKITVYISEKCTNMGHAFRISSLDTKSTIKEIEIVGDTSKINTANQAFMNRTSIERIIGEFDFSSCTNATDMFLQCENLKEFYPKADTIGTSVNFASCSKLVLECAKSILLGLKNYSGTENEFINKVTFHSDVWIMLDAEGNTAPDGTTWRDYTENKGWNN